MARAKNSEGVLHSFKKDGKKAAKRAAYSPLMDRLTRVGYGVKGLIYITMGFLAIQGTLGNNRTQTPADQLGAIRTFGRLPFAHVLLWVILIGLISYALWGLIRAFLDPFHKGNDAAGLLARAGFLISAVTYAFFILPTLDLIRGGAGSSQASRTQRFIAAVLALPFGRVLVVLGGLAAVLGGIYQIYLGISSTFEQQFKPYALNAEQRKLATDIGRFGTIARGIVFAIVGFFFVLAGYFANPHNAATFDGALRFLARQPYGLWLMAIVAVGLMAFGVYSIISAAWFRFKR